MDLISNEKKEKEKKKKEKKEEKTNVAKLKT